MNDWIGEIKDPRNESYCTYTQQELICLGILKNVCGIESMRQMNKKFNEEPLSADAGSGYPDAAVSVL